MASEIYLMVSLHHIKKELVMRKKSLLVLLLLACATISVMSVQALLDCCIHNSLASRKNSSDILILSVIPNEGTNGKLTWIGEDADKKQSYNLLELTQDAVIYMPQGSLRYLKADPHLSSRVVSVEHVRKSTGY